jgi:RND family efflux transporter MFP subunit
MMKSALTGLSIAAILFLLGCANKDQDTLKEEVVPQVTTTAKVERHPRTVEIAATVRAADVAHLASRFGGFVSRVPVTAGMQVKKGTLLVLLDDRNLTAQRQKIFAGSLEARRAAEGAEAQMHLASNTFERVRGLYEKKSASSQEFEEAESKKKAAEASYQAAMQRIAQSESDLRDVNATTNYLRITAPFDGVITSVDVDAGTFVNAGQTIASMENPDAYEVVFAVEEDLLKELPRNKQVPVAIPSISSDRFTATIAELSTATDSSTRTFQVKATLPSHPGIRTGLSARVFVTASSGSSLWIPENFLVQKNDVETVLVRQQDQWRRILVKSGNHKDGKVEILSGLNEGEEVGKEVKKQ